MSKMKNSLDRINRLVMIGGRMNSKTERKTRNKNENTKQNSIREKQNIHIFK